MYSKVVSWIAGHKVLVAAVAVCLAVAVTAAVLFLPATPKRLFLAAEAKYLQDCWRTVEDRYADTWALAGRMTTGPSSSSLDIGVDLQIVGSGVLDQTMGELGGGYSGLGYNPLQLVVDIVGQSRFVVAGRQDPETDRQLSTLTYMFDDTELASVTTMRYGDRYAVDIPVLLDRCVTFENRNLRQTLGKLGINPAFDRILTDRDVRQAVTMTPGQLRRIARDYMAFIAGNIDEAEVTLTDGVDYASPEGDIKLRRLTLTLSETRLKELLRGVLEKLKQDAATQELIAENVASVATVYAEAGYDLASDDLTDPGLVRERLNLEIAHLIAGLERLGFPEGLEVSLLVDRGKDIVRQDVRFAVHGQSWSGPLTFELTDERWSRGDSRRGGTSIAISSPGTTGRLLYTCDRRAAVDGRDELETATHVIEYTGRDSGDEPIGLEIESQWTRNRDSGKQRGVADFKLTGPGNDYAPAASLQGRLTQVVDGGPRDDRYHRETTAEVSMPGLDCTVTADYTLTFPGEVDLPEFPEAGSFDLTRADEVEVAEFRSRIESSLQSFIIRNAGLLYQ